MRHSDEELYEIIQDLDPMIYDMMESEAEYLAHFLESGIQRFTWIDSQSIIYMKEKYMP